VAEKKESIAATVDDSRKSIREDEGSDFVFPLYLELFVVVLMFAACLCDAIEGKREHR
jgi:hypothetical protein